MSRSGLTLARRTMNAFFRPALTALTLALFSTVSAAQAPESRLIAATPVSGAPTYTDLVDLVMASPVIADATIRSTTRIKGAEAAAVLPGQQRLYVETEVTALIKGEAGLPPRIGYLLDVTPDRGGRFAKLKKLRTLVFARRVSGSADQVQLSAPDAQLPWSTDLDARVREIARQAVAKDVPPAIIGVGGAFHVAGSLPDEGETQIFLLAQGGRPVSLSILRRPGEQTRYSVALSEIVDEAAGPPAPNTLLWYRLACGLPRALPAASTTRLEPADAAIAQEDYGFVLDALGPCGRSRG